MRSCAATGTAAALSIPAAASRQSVGSESVEYQNFFGDLHNHNQIGYAQGTLQRSYELARNHLDFYAFTPHAYWPDIGTYDGNIQNKWINGFHVAKARWPEVVRLARLFDDPGKFVTILGYERHGTAEGDYHLLFPDLKGDYELIVKLNDLQKYARQRGCILVPHHPANRLGHRGFDVQKVDPDVSPVLEIYSEWGCAEHDRAPRPYKRHTEGGRWTRNTFSSYLHDGYRFGVIGSTDDHLGYPGAYREGLAAIKAPALTRPAIFDALRNRRTYAVTGDRIQLDFSLNGRMMGQELEFERERLLKVEVKGWDVVDRIEVVKNGRVIHRHFPGDSEPSTQSWQHPVLLRFEYGWGPWPALGWGGTADWDFVIQLRGARIVDLQPCFTSGPLDEVRRDKIVRRTVDSIQVQSFTALKQQLDDYSQKAIVLEILGAPETQINVSCTKPAPCSLTQTLGQLSQSNEMLFTRPFPWESAMLHRVVFNEQSAASFTVEDEGVGTRTDWYYVRVFQTNGELAWSSPIWVDQA